MKTCDDFAGLGVTCCDSCHDDRDFTGEPMVELYSDADAYEGEVCCTVARALDGGQS